jgi:predicted phage replisome organizer
MPNGKDYILFYLKLLCESVDHEGNLRFSEQIPYSVEMLSTITNTNVDIVRSAINIFTELQMMEIMDDGTYFMNEVNKMIGASSQDEQTRESTRLRVQAYRERKKTALLPEKRYSNVTCNGEIEKEIEKEIENKSKKKNTKTASPLDEILSEITSEELKQTYRDYIEMRNKIKAPMTARALRTLINKVDSLETSIDGKCALLETAILNNWKSVYAPKEQPKKPQNPRNPKAPTKSDGFMDELQDMYWDIIKNDIEE